MCIYIYIYIQEGTKWGGINGGGRCKSSQRLIQLHLAATKSLATAAPILMPPPFGSSRGEHALAQGPRLRRRGVAPGDPSMS